MTLEKSAVVDLVVVLRRLHDAANLAGALAGACNPAKAPAYLVNDHPGVAAQARLTMQGEPGDLPALDNLVGGIKSRRRAATEVLCEQLAGKQSAPVTEAERKSIAAALAEVQQVIIDFDALIVQ